MNYKKICEVFRSLALTSGEAIMEIYNHNKFEVLLKSDDSPVTTADKQADKIISKGLKKYFPEIGGCKNFLKVSSKSSTCSRE